MKTNKKFKKIAAGITGTVLVLFLCFFVNSWVGNPVSNFMTKKAAQKYISQNYSELNLEIKDVFYNFKDGNYCAFVQSKDSIDTAFSVYSDSFGHIKRDDYEGEVLSNFTTLRRIDGEFRDYGKKLFTENLPEYDINLANFMLKDTSGEEYLKKLTRDMPFDPYNPPMELEAAVWIYDEDLSFDKMAEVMLKMKNICEKENLPISYYNVRIDNIEKETVDGEERAERTNTWLYDVPKEVLEEKNLAEALENLYNERYNREKEYEKD